MLVETHHRLLKKIGKMRVIQRIYIEANENVDALHTPSIFYMYQI